jgi:signal transduction histidine kinase
VIESNPVLVVDDSAVDREKIRRLVGTRYELVEAATALEALEVSRRRHFDCILLDHRLPDMDGVTLVKSFVSDGSAVVMLTGCGNERVAVAAMKEGACDYLTKDDLGAELLRRAIQNAQEKAALTRELALQTSRLRDSRDALARTNLELQKSEARARMVLDQLPAVTWTTNARLVYRHVAGSALDAMGLRPEDVLDDGIAQGALALNRDEAAVAAHESALAGESASYDAESADALFSCYVRPWYGDGDTPVGVIGVAMDVTEKRDLDRRLRRSQKLEAVGQLAGGVAHDFNNILTAIINFTAMAAEDLPDPHPVRSDLQGVLDAAERAARLTRQLLMFARENAVRPEHLDIGALVRELHKMLRRLLTEDITLVVEVADEACPALVDRSSMEQLLVNLVVNARDAIPRSGRIDLRVRPVELGDDESRPLGIEPGSHLLVEVEDSGVGIPPDVLERIFEPFFTTKNDSGGTGLGLSTCYGIVSDHDGAIVVDSEPGRGTRFSTYLPRAEDPGLAVAPPRKARPSRGSETILVAEDQPQLRALIERVLQSLGYRVLLAVDGKDALDVAHRCAVSIDLLLTDVIMPGLDGVALHARLRARNPDLRVVFMSGYSRGTLSDRAALHADAVYLPKPFDPADLAKTVRAALDGECRVEADPLVV